MAFLHFYQLSVITSKPKHVNFQCLWFRDSNNILIFFQRRLYFSQFRFWFYSLSHRLRLSIGFPSPSKICKSPIGNQLHHVISKEDKNIGQKTSDKKDQTKNIGQKTSDKKHRTKTLIRITTCHIKREQKTSNNVSLKIFLFKNIGVSLKISFLTIIS